MAQDHLISDQKRGLSLVQNKDIGSNDQITVFGQSCNLLIEQSHENVLSSGHGSCICDDLGLGSGSERYRDVCLKLDQDRELLMDCELALSQVQNHGDGLENEKRMEQRESVKPDVDLNKTSIEKFEPQLDPYAEKNEFDLLENRGLTIVEDPEIDKNLAIVHKNDDMGNALGSDMVDLPLVVVPPVLQNRNLFPDPVYELAVGQTFPDVSSCRRAIRETAIALHFEIETLKSDKTRFTAKCASEGCPWRIHAAKGPGVPTCTIKTIHSEHICGGISHPGHQQASVQWIADSVEQILKENPNYKPKDIVEKINRDHGITLTYKQAWRGKERVMAVLHESYDEDYHLLPQYCDQIRRSNPGSIASVYVNPSDGCFQRLFVSYHASIYGFLNACRPLLSLDRIVLESKYLSTLLVATGYDGNGELFPLAFGVVEEENENNWIWFLSELHHLMETNTKCMPKLTILSDMKRGIVDGVELSFPTAIHGYCMRFLTESFQEKFNNSDLSNLFLEAATALTVFEYEAKMLEIGGTSQEAAFWIQQFPPQSWATAYFQGIRFAQLTANIVESVESWIMNACNLPIIELLECIRRRLMTWFSERREASAQWASMLVPSAERLVSGAFDCARTYQVFRVNEAECEVLTAEMPFVVDIQKRQCACQGWQLLGLPCSHAAAALLFCNQIVCRFTESCYSAATYRNAYSETIHPVPDKRHWNQDDEVSDLNIVIYPPKSILPLSRPRKKRVRSADQGRVKRTVHCSRCNQTGHFRTTCSTLI
ncbi:uncharacterized protein LOC141700902 [Apium graveolens]|uniref:uncharacterized protein LOC141700902 n=1 Tax=Apium graveolens TaxID=4045 RepID=UPI003D7A5DEC